MAKLEEQSKAIALHKAIFDIKVSTTSNMNASQANPVRERNSVKVPNSSPLQQIQQVQQIISPQLPTKRESLLNNFDMKEEQKYDLRQPQVSSSYVNEVKAVYDEKVERLKTMNANRSLIEALQHLGNMGFTDYQTNVSLCNKHDFVQDDILDDLLK